MRRLPAHVARSLLSRSNQARISMIGAALLAMAFVSSALQRVAAEEEYSYRIGYMGVGETGAAVAHVLGFINPDGSSESYPDFGQPGQRSWVFGPLFSDGRRIILTSYEDSDVTKVRAGKVVTHDWIYDLASGGIKSTLQKARQADQLRPYSFLPGDRRVIETAIIGNEERIFIKDLDGGNSVELTTAGGGFHYALELSHDAKRLACHVTGGAPAFYNTGMYSINVFDLANAKRILVAGQPEHLFFGPRWSPDDKWLAYLDCHATADPAHFRAALAIGRSDGAEHRVVTPGQDHWFGTPFGSNMTEWSPDGTSIAFTRLQDNSKSDMSQGGAQLCLLNPFTKRIVELTPAKDGVWDYRAAWSPDGSELLFTRARLGSPRELWRMDKDGANPRFLTNGYKHAGADFPRWLRVRTNAN